LLAVSLELGEEVYTRYFEQGRSAPSERVVAGVLEASVPEVTTPDAS
jgi:hypothetical protein